MKPSLNSLPYSVMALGLLLAAAGCKSNPSQPASGDQTAAAAVNPQDPGDPANANLAPIPVTYTKPAASTAARPRTASSSRDAGARYGGANPDDSGYDYSADYDDASYDPQPDQYADEPPPQLPTYDQPPMPQPGYLWTPGYWSYAQTGYYWVPGAWVEPPYSGALWTPGYWGFHSGRYGYNHGYWGRYVGFYGGVNYGFGYAGTGYQGGYWRDNSFAYNREVNNFGSARVENVYNRTIVINRTIVRDGVSYNGGPRGIEARPTPAEVAAFRAPHAPPMRAQIELSRSAATNRAQFLQVNHGRPAVFAAATPLQADRNIHPAPIIRPPVIRQAADRPGEQPRSDARPQQPGPGLQPENKPGERPGNPAVPRPILPDNRPQAGHPAPGRPDARSQPGQRPEMQPQARPDAHPQPGQRPELQPQPGRAEPGRPQARPEAPPQPVRPTAAQPQPLPRPAERAHPEAHPQPAPPQPARPQQAGHPQPEHPQPAHPQAEHANKPAARPDPRGKPEPKKPEENPKL